MMIMQETTRKLDNCQYHDWEAEIGASQEQNINKEELDLGSVKVHIILFVAD